MATRTIDTDSEAIIVLAAFELSTLTEAQHVTIESCDTSFSTILGLLDSETLACLLSGYVATCEIIVVVPWNGSNIGQMRIVSVDSEMNFSNVKRIGPETRIEVIQRARRMHQQLVSRQTWSETVSKQYPGQDLALSQLINIIMGQSDHKTSVGVLISGSDAENFVKIVSQCSGLPVHHIQMSQLFSSRPGHAERQLQNSLQLACRYAPAVVIVQDLELLRHSSQAERLRLHLEQFMDDLQLEQSEAQMVILAPVQGPVASLPSSLRRSLRFDHVVLMRNLDPIARCSILKEIIGKDHDIEAISARTTGFTRGDLHRLGLEAALRAISSGRKSVLAEDLDAALDCIRPSELDDRFGASMPSMPLSSMADIDGTIARLRAAVLTPLQNPNAYHRLGIRPPRGVLLFGPSGVGKTTLALGIAAEANAAVIEARGCNLISAVVGDSERAIRELFQKARAIAPAVIVLDQVETLAPRRDRDQSRTFDRVLSCLLTEMDGVTSRASDAPVVIVIGTTSFRNRMDDAILRSGRFDEQIEIGLPDWNGRHEILSALAQRTAGFSGADLNGFCIEAAMNALRRDRQASLVSAADFDAAFPM